MKRLFIFVLAAALAGCATQPPPAPEPQVTTTVAPEPAPAASFRATPPPPAPPRPYSFPQVHRVTLDNGMRVLVARMTNAPLVTIRAVVRAGAAHEPADHAGLATMTAALVDEGAGNRSAIQIAEDLALLGASLGSGAFYDSSFVTLDILSTQLERGFPIFADVVRRPRFPQDDFNRVKRDRLTSLLQQRDQAGVIATNRFAQFVYGDRPYGRPVIGTPATVERITRSDVQRFYRDYWAPNNVSLIIVGDVDPAAATELARRHFADWRRGRTAPPVQFTAPEASKSQIFLVDRPAAVQSEIRIGHVGVPRSSEDYFPILTMNAILGRIFTSRLNLNLRERHGYTYGARSEFAFRTAPGPFYASSAVRNQVTAEAVRETINELQRIGSGDLTDEELEFAKNYMMGVFPASVETAGQVARRIEELELYGLPPDYFDHYRARIAAVTKDDVLRAARTHIRPENLVILVVGRASEVREPLLALGFNLTLYDIEGMPAVR